LLHGVYCLGCCWLLFVALFPLGMTIEAMAAVTLIILGEKTLPRPEFVSYGAAAALVVCGMLMAVAPELPAVLRVFGSLTEDKGLGLGSDPRDNSLVHRCQRGETEALDHPPATSSLLGQKAIQHTVRYTELAPTRFKSF